MTFRGLSHENDRGYKWDVGKYNTCPPFSSPHLSTTLINKVSPNAIYDVAYRIAVLSSLRKLR